MLLHPNWWHKLCQVNDCQVNDHKTSILQNLSYTLNFIIICFQLLLSNVVKLKFWSKLMSRKKPKCFNASNTQIILERIFDDVQISIMYFLPQGKKSSKNNYL